MDDYDLLALFTAACLASGKSAQDAVSEAQVTLDMFEEVVGEEPSEIS